VLERGCREQFDPDMARRHVGHVQQQLRVCVHVHLRAAEAAALDAQVAAVVIRIDVHETAAHDPVARLVRARGSRHQHRRCEQADFRHFLHGCTPVYSNTRKTTAQM
jgi:hypothetical protein